MKRDFSYLIVWGAIFIGAILATNAAFIEYNYVSNLNKEDSNVVARKSFDTDNVNINGTSDR